MSSINWTDVADYARGSCNSDADIAAAFEMSQEDEDRIGEILFDEHELVVCEQCGWWHDLGEVGNCPTGEHEQMCDNCCDDQGGHE